MTSEDNPLLYIKYNSKNPDQWIDITPYAVELKVKNGGIFKTPECTVRLKNTDGYFSITQELKLGKWLWVNADVRGIQDVLFYGRIETTREFNERKREFIEVTARGMLQKLLNETITRKYGTQQEEKMANRTMKQVIEDFLSNPDSGANTGITLATDTGNITTVNPRQDFDKTTLFDALNQICEYVGYGGYEYSDYSSNVLYLYPYGWEAASPAVTITQAAIERERTKTLDETFNHLFLWSLTATGGYPSGDCRTEGDAAAWTPQNGECSISDDSTVKRINNKSIKITKTAGSLTIVGGTTQFPVDINCNLLQLTSLCFNGKLTPDTQPLMVTLTDSANREITWADSVPVGNKQFKDGWAFLAYPIGIVAARPPDYPSQNYSNWHIREIGSPPPQAYPRDTWIGDTNFSWNAVRKINVQANTGTGTATMWIDGLHFEGRVLANPLVDTTLQVSDSASITEYDRRVQHVQDDIIKNYGYLNEYAQKLLGFTKNPIIKLKTKQGAKTWIKPNQTVNVNIPIYGISDKPYRVVELEFDWSTTTKLLRSTLYLTPQFLDDGITVRPVTGREWYRGQVESILKEITW